MFRREHLIWMGLIFVYLTDVSSGWKMVLDTDKDLFRSWKLDGAYEYYKNGESLDLLHDVLPKDFDYEAFKNVEGIWAILPETGVNSTENSATFKFSTAAQLLDSIDITYCIGGKAKILINSTEKTLFTIRPSDQPEYQLVTMSVPLNPTSRFIVEGVVTDPGDFILIDKIGVNYMEVTTPKPRTTQPPSPTAKPIVSLASCSTPLNLYMALILLLITLSSV